MLNVNGNLDMGDLDDDLLHKEKKQTNKEIREKEKEKAIKSMEYLLQMSTKYSSFVKEKLSSLEKR